MEKTVHMYNINTRVVHDIECGRPLVIGQYVMWYVTTTPCCSSGIPHCLSSERPLKHTTEKCLPDDVFPRVQCPAVLYEHDDILPSLSRREEGKNSHVPASNIWVLAFWHKLLQRLAAFVTIDLRIRNACQNQEPQNS